MLRIIFAFFLTILLPTMVLAESKPLAVIDTHIHYSHDAWGRIPPPEAVRILRDAGLKKAFVSSSSDEGTQKLYQQAPDLIVPVLRPYRLRGETGTWMHDETVIDMLSELLEKNQYAGIGEFHAFGSDIELPVLQAVIALAKKHKLFLHAHSDADAIKRIFKHDPSATVLWAHSGFVSPDEVRAMLAEYPNLWADLAFRSSHAINGEVDPEWETLFTDYPNRFMVGADTFTPERWYYIVEHANWSRAWLNTLPQTLAENIAHKNAENLINNARLK